MAYVVSWGQGRRRTVNSAGELDAVLDEIQAEREPTLVGIYPPEYLSDDFDPWADVDRPLAIQLGIGHADRSFAILIGDGGGEAVQADLPPWPHGTPDIAFDYNGEPVYCGQERARVSPQTARQAARELVTTGKRPTCVTWAEPL